MRPVKSTISLVKPAVDVERIQVGSANLTRCHFYLIHVLDTVVCRSATEPPLSPVVAAAGMPAQRTRRNTAVGTAIELLNWREREGRARSRTGARARSASHDAVAGRDLNLGVSCLLCTWSFIVTHLMAAREL